MSCRINNARWTLLFLLAALTGCGDGLVPLNARVTLDGKPCEGATVSLKPEDGKGRTATGVTVADGSVTFTSYKPFDGVTPGNYKVCVSKYIYTIVPKASSGKRAGKSKADTDAEPPVEETVTVEDAARASIMPHGTQVTGMPITKPLLPAIYCSPKTTPFSCTVPSSEKEVVFALETPQGPNKNRR